MPTTAMMLSGTVAGGGAVSGSKTITVDHTKCGPADTTDFAFLFKGTYSYLADVAHGGQLTDIKNVAWYSDSGLTTLLKFERSKHDLTTGAVVYRVKIPTLTHSTDPVIYVGWDITNTSTDHADPTNVYKSSFKRDYHLGDGSSLSGADATANAGTATVTNATAATGQVWGAAHFTNSSNQYLNEVAAPVTTYPLTLQALVKLSTATFSGSEERIIVAVVNKSNLNEFWLSYFNPGLIQVRGVAQSGGSALSRGANVTADTSWHHVAAVFTNSSTISVYYDGAETTGASGTPNTPSGLDNTYIGGMFFNTSTFYGQMRGDVEEVRISNAALSASEILATANNQLDPASFYAVT
jgi:hypothetical protein